MPSYLHFFQGQSCLRFTHLDRYLSIASDVIPAYKFRNSTTKRGLKNHINISNFCRTHLLWNRLPLSLREINRPSEFKSKLMDYIWTHLETIENKFDEELHESYD